MSNNKKVVFLNKIYNIFFMGDIIEFKKEERNNLKRNLLIGGGLLGSGIALAALLKGKKVNKQVLNSLPQTKNLQPKSEVGVKSYIRNGKIVKAHRKRVIKAKPKNVSTENNKKIISYNTKQYISEPSNKVKNEIDIFENELKDLNFKDSRTFDKLYEKYNFEKIDDLYYSEKDYSESLVKTLRDKFIVDNNINETEKKALNTYIGRGYKFINGVLTGTIKPDAKILKIIENLDDCLKKAPEYNRQDKKLYRYIKIDNSDSKLIDSILNNYKVESIIEESRYLSTSSDPLFNADWISESPIRFVIKPKAKDIRFFYYKEKEVLFERNTKFKINNINKTEDETWSGYEIEMEEI